MGVSRTNSVGRNFAEQLIDVQGARPAKRPEIGANADPV